jgi:endogenous inhibitor of DNA gyrase (YacG/DUF329 family)
LNTKIIDAKCPYCKTEIKTSAFGSRWAQCLWGEYAPNSINHTCPSCGKEIIVSVNQTFRYSAKKIR